MSLALLLTLQAAAPAPAASAAPEPVPVDFDLAKYHRSKGAGCGDASGAEIVVCGRRFNQDPDPDGRLARLYGDERPLRAEVGIGGGATANAHVESAEMPRGAVAKRIMFGVKAPF